MPPKPQDPPAPVSREPKIEVKNIKHKFTLEERNEIGENLARSIGELRGAQTEFDQVKAGFKARITSAEAQIDNLSTALVNGFDMRNEKLRVIYRPQDRKKDYYKIHDGKSGFGREDLDPVLTEDMTPADFQSELLQAESIFANREELELFRPAGEDRGALVVGMLAGKWFSALRIKIGKLELTERLDSEQPCFKFRADAVKKGVKRASDWAKENLKDLAKGFQEQFDTLAKSQAERVE